MDPLDLLRNQALQNSRRHNDIALDASLSGLDGFTEHGLDALDSGGIFGLRVLLCDAECGGAEADDETLVGQWGGNGTGGTLMVEGFGTTGAWQGG